MLPVVLWPALCAAAPTFEITGFDVEGNTLLAPAEVQRALAPYRGPGRTFADVQHALAALQEAYARRGYKLVRVALPEQELDHGVVRLKVVETRIGRVTVEGNRFFDEANIRHSLPGLREGEGVDLARLSTDLARANENPAKKTTVEMQGAGEGQVDAHVVVADEKPWRVGFSADNTGTRETGRTMLGFAYQNVNVAGLDHAASLQYITTAEEPRRVSVYAAGYRVPLYTLGDSVDVYGSYSDVDSGTVLAGILDLQLSGKGTVLGARYNHGIARIGALDSAVSLGIEHRAYRNDIALAGIPLGNDITLHPLTLAWSGAWKAAESDTAFSVSAVRNLPGGEHGTAEDFARVRADARSGYSLLRYSATHLHALPADWQFRASVSGQVTRASLVPGEQFGAGGVASVRGFENREATGDEGYSGSFELYTPDLCARRWSATACRVLAFYDGARVSRNHALPGEADHASIGSMGLGWRGSIGRHATLQLDYGHVVEGDSVERRGANRVNFRLALSY